MVDQNKASGTAGRAHDKIDIEALIHRITQQAVQEHAAIFSTRTYADEPIMRTGADLARSHTRQEPRTRQDEKRQTPPARAQQLRREPRHSSATNQHALDMHLIPANQQKAYPQGGLANSSPSTRSLSETRRRPTHSLVELPPLLRELRALEQTRDADGRPLSEDELFLSQAQLAKDYVDDYAFPGHIPWRRRPRGYQDLSNGELRAYFSWRAAWHTGDHSQVPPAFATLLAYEFINGIGAEQGKDALDKLELLASACEEGMGDSWDGGASWNVVSWTRDYAQIYGLVEKTTAAQTRERYSRAVLCLRRIERDALAQAGVQGFTADEVGGTQVDDKEFLSALSEISTFKPERSPFVRSNQESFAAVSRAVFCDYALHCAKRRKMLLVDSLVGFEETLPFVPFVGVPLPSGWEGPDRTMDLGSGLWVRRTNGLWMRHRPWQAMRKDREITRLLRAIDRQMRIDWDFGHPLKEIDLPKYLAKFVLKRSSERRQQELEAEKRRFTVDVSKLDSIRSSAAVIREALLVDEEREEEPQEAPAPREEVDARSASAKPEAAPAQDKASTAESPAPLEAPCPPQTDQEPAPSAKADQAATTTQAVATSLPYDLTEAELSLLHTLLGDREPSALSQSSAAPSIDMLVDSINEKLFDLVGDVVIEFSDEGTPCLISDYLPDVRGALQA